MVYFSLTVTVQAPFKLVISDNSKVELSESLTFFVIWGLAYYIIRTVLMFSLVFC